MLRHPCRGIFANQDAFPGGNSSLACSFVPQGLFLPSGCIPGMLFCSTGIISSVRMHPWHALLFHRDYFFRRNASLACSFVPQGLFLSSGCISGMLFYSTGCIPTLKFIPAETFLQIRMRLVRVPSGLGRLPISIVNLPASSQFTLKCGRR